MIRNQVTVRSVVVFACLLGVAGCKQKLSKEKVEGVVKSAFADQASQMKSVSCPEDREIKVGDELECTGELASGAKFTAKVKVTDEQGQVSVKIPGLVNPKALAAELGPKVGGTVKCPENLVIVTKGSTLDCELTAGGATKKLVLTAEDDQGGWDYKIVGGDAPPAAAPAAPASAAAHDDHAGGDHPSE